jgi:zinc protease
VNSASRPWRCCRFSTKRRAAALHLACLAAATVGMLLTASARATTIERVISPGGIEAWLVHEPAVPLIAVDFAFTGGAVQDAPGKSGSATLVASLLDAGAGDLDSKTFSDQLERKAIQMGFSAQRDTIRGTMRTLIENRDAAFDLLRLAVTAPRFDTKDVEISRAQVLSLLRRETTSPADIANRRWWEIAFEGHPYSRPVNGTPDTISSISIADLKSYAHRVLARGNLTIAVVGDIDAETFKSLLDRTFGALPAKPELVPIANVAPRGLGRRIEVSLDVPQTVVDFGGPGIARQDPDFMAAYLVNHILGGGSSASRLYQEVREKRGLAYTVSDSLVWLNHTAVLLGGTATRADRAGETIDLLQSEIQRFADGGPTAGELMEAKKYLNSAFVLDLDSSTKIAALLVQLQLDGLGPDYISRRAAMIDGVTLEDARRVAKRLLDKGLLVTVVGKPQGFASTKAN